MSHSSTLGHWFERSSVGPRALPGENRGFSPGFDGKLERSALPSVAVVAVYAESQPVNQSSKIMCLLRNSLLWL